MPQQRDLPPTVYLDGLKRELERVRRSLEQLPEDAPEKDREEAEARVNGVKAEIRRVQSTLEGGETATNRVDGERATTAPRGRRVAS